MEGYGSGILLALTTNSYLILPRDAAMSDFLRKSSQSERSFPDPEQHLHLSYTEVKDCSSGSTIASGFASGLSASLGGTTCQNLER